jgi:molybdopterin-guanine dinucleotide biosynthesis adapter protein
MPMRVIGFAGWSGTGKTTLIVRLIPELTRSGFRFDGQARSRST